MVVADGYWGWVEVNFCRGDCDVEDGNIGGNIGGFEAVNYGAAADGYLAACFFDQGVGFYEDGGHGEVERDDIAGFPGLVELCVCAWG